MYQKLAYVAHLHRPTVNVYYELNMLVKKRYFSATLRQCFQISIRNLVAQLHLTTDAVLKQYAKIILPTFILENISVGDEERAVGAR